MQHSLRTKDPIAAEDLYQEGVDCLEGDAGDCSTSCNAEAKPRRMSRKTRQSEIQWGCEQPFAGLLSGGWGSRPGLVCSTGCEKTPFSFRFRSFRYKRAMIKV